MYTVITLLAKIDRSVSAGNFLTHIIATVAEFTIAVVTLFVIRGVRQPVGALELGNAVAAHFFFAGGATTVVAIIIPVIALFGSTILIILCSCSLYDAVAAARIGAHLRIARDIRRARSAVGGAAVHTRIVDASRDQTFLDAQSCRIFPARRFVRFSSVR